MPSSSLAKHIHFASPQTHIVSLFDNNQGWRRELAQKHLDTKYIFILFKSVLEYLSHFQVWKVSHSDDGPALSGHVAVTSDVDLGGELGLAQQGDLALRGEQ